MSTLIALSVMAGLLLVMVIIMILRLIDWRDFFIKRFGPDYTKGLAHILLDGVWVYRESELFYKGDDAMSYTRRVGNTWVEDIVPTSIGFSYDEYTGRRQYRVCPGGSIGYSDEGEAPAVDYPSQLVSAHLLARTAVNYGTTVNAEDKTNWKPIIIGAIVLVVIIGGIFLTGIVKLPGTTAKAPSAPVTTTTPAIITPLPSTGPVEVK